MTSSYGDKRVVFVTGTGTDIGKTYISAALIRETVAAGQPVVALKPIISGAPDLADPAFEATDTAVLLRAQGLPVNAKEVEACSPWRFKAPLSLDMAADLEGRSIDFDAVIAWTRARIESAPVGAFVLVEGVGGVMSPVAAQHTNLDMVAELNVKTILVAGNHLGGISHTLTAAEAIRARGLHLAAVVVNEGAGALPPLAATVETLRRFLPRQKIISVARNSEASGVRIYSLLAAAPSAG